MACVDGNESGTRQLGRPRQPALTRWLGGLWCPAPHYAPLGWMGQSFIVLRLSGEHIYLAPIWWARLFAWWTWFNFPTRASFRFAYTRVEGVEMLQPPYHRGVLVGINLTEYPFALAFYCGRGTADEVIRHFQAKGIPVDVTLREFRGSAFWARAFGPAADS